jgi:hypothetical protein
VSIYAEVWNGEYGQASDVRIVHFDSIVSGQVSADQGKNSVNWTMVDQSQQVQFGDTTVSLSYEPVKLPDGVPQIQFADGSPPIGFPGPKYYPTVLEAVINVTRGPDDNNPTDLPVETPPLGNEPPASVPEPTSAMLLTGFALGGWMVRRNGEKRS